MIIVADDNIPFLEKIFSPCGKIFLFSGRNLTNGFLKETGCEALFVRSTTRVDEKLLHGTNVKFVATATAGSDHIDKNFLSENGIKFFAAEGSNSNAVAEYVVFVILHWAKEICTKEKIPPEEFLYRKKIGIIGFGHVGKKVSLYAHQLGLKILVNDPPLAKENFSFPDFVEYTTKEKICSECEIVTNHVPLIVNGEFPTKNLFSEKEISLLKENSLFIHASRGGVVNENFLLQNGKIFSVIDVWENEPDVNPESVRTAWIATPHIAGHTWNAKLNGAKMVTEEFARWSGCHPDFTIAEEKILPKKYFPAEELYEILFRERKIPDDSIQFKGKISAGEKIFFDEFRRNYPQRYETLKPHDGI